VSILSTLSGTAGRIGVIVVVIVVAVLAVNVPTAARVVALLQLLLDLALLERADEVDHQLAGQVVELVLHAAAEQTLPLGLEHLPVDPHRAQPRLPRALDRDVDAGEGQAALLPLLLVGRDRDDLRVDEGDRVAPISSGDLGVDQEHAERLADLHRGDADSVVRVHGVGQVAVERADLVRDLRNRARLLAQARIRPDDDGANCHGGLTLRSGSGAVKQGYQMLTAQLDPRSR
jgi:hypothetical protein